jgi:hypothetical protein
VSCEHLLLARINSGKISGGPNLVMRRFGQPFERDMRTDSTVINFGERKASGLS